MKINAPIVILALAGLLTPAMAEDGYAKFAWALTREQALFASVDKPAVKAGETLGALTKTAFTLHRQPGAQAAFAMPPERKPKAERWFGGMVRLAAPEKPGIYQVTLSEEARIDVVKDGRYARAVGSTGRSDCPGLRKSVRLDLAAAPFVLELSGVAAEQVVVAINPRE